MTALDQGPATETVEHDVTAHQLFVWALFMINALMIVITYLHVSVTDLYHVSEGGFAGGLGRVLVFTNFPTSLAALALIGLAVRRIRRSGMVMTTRARHTVFRDRHRRGGALPGHCRAGGGRDQRSRCETGQRHPRASAC